jgi:hypothetical protein
MSRTLTEITKWHKYKGFHLRGTVKMPLEIIIAKPKFTKESQYINFFCLFSLYKLCLAFRSQFCFITMYYFFECFDNNSFIAYIKYLSVVK